MTKRDYYEVLGVAPRSDGATVDQAYWHLAKAYQTQSVTDPRARQLLDELNEAYGVLGTPRLRDDYDALIRVAIEPTGSATRRHPRQRASSWFARRFLHKKEAPAAKPSLVRARTTTGTAADLHQTPPAHRRLKTDVSELRDSTTRMLERWRTTTGAHQEQSSGPDMTLVDIFKSEQELSGDGDPLTAVMEVLKAPKDVVPTTSGK
jgi:curved DNA-binding protein CbpA